MTTTGTVVKGTAGLLKGIVGMLNERSKRRIFNAMEDELSTSRKISISKDQSGFGIDPITGQGKVKQETKISS